MSFDSRQLIYDVMLQRLSMVQRLNIQCRLAREVLEHAADLMDEDDELSPSMNAALLDTTTLLTGPRLKLPSKYFSFYEAEQVKNTAVLQLFLNDLFIYRKTPKSEQPRRVTGKSNY